LTTQVIEVRVRVGNERLVGEEVDRIEVAHLCAPPEAGFQPWWWAAVRYEPLAARD
jgi:hypothetical protein